MLSDPARPPYRDPGEWRDLANVTVFLLLTSLLFAAIGSRVSLTIALLGAGLLAFMCGYLRTAHRKLTGRSPTAGRSPGLPWWVLLVFVLLLGAGVLVGAALAPHPVLFVLVVAGTIAVLVSSQAGSYLRMRVDDRRKLPWARSFRVQGDERWER